MRLRLGSCVVLCMVLLGLRAETSFIAVDASTKEEILVLGPHVDVRCSPFSTFKIPLSLAGYELGILSSVDAPVWPYGGEKTCWEAHQGSQSPKTWMGLSVTWYSQKLAGCIGKERLQAFLSQWHYGNQDLSGDGSAESYRVAHLSSSLRISPREQVSFLVSLVREELPLSSQAMRTTKELLRVQSNAALNLLSGRLFGKAGSGCDGVAWYVGWLEAKEGIYVFALLMKDLIELPTKEERQQQVLKLLGSYIE